MECGLVFGGLSVPGKFVVEQNVSRDRINEILEQVMEKNNITDKIAEELNAKCQKMRNRYKLNTEDLVSALAGTIGIDALFDGNMGKIDDYVKMLMHGDLSHLTDVASFAMSLSGAAAAVVTAPESFSAALLGIVSSLGLTSAMRAIQDIIDNGTDMELVQGMLAASALNAIYEEVNKRIDSEAGGLIKKIVFDGNTRACFDDRTVFGVGGNTLFLSVDGVLEAGPCGKQMFQSEREKPGYFSGIYTGSLTVKATYDASKFDENFLSDVFKAFPGRSILKEFYNLQDEYFPSIITKEVRFADVTVSVDSRRERFSGSKKVAYPKFGASTETNTCVIDHTVRCSMKTGLYTDGHYSISGDTANNYIDYSFYGKIVDSFFGKIIVNKAKITENYAVHAPYVDRFFDFSRELNAGGHVLMTDNDLFWFLKKPPYLYYNIDTYEEHNKDLLY
ncbi:MAG: hypothetical protein MJ175_08690 [Clostridia bacterium]|nr:hypothetical protein [Clostridia bacterium]